MERIFKIAVQAGMDDDFDGFFVKSETGIIRGVVNDGILEDFNHYPYGDDTRRAIFGVYDEENEMIGFVKIDKNLCKISKYICHIRDHKDRLFNNGRCMRLKNSLWEEETAIASFNIMSTPMAMSYFKPFNDAIISEYIDIINDTSQSAFTYFFN